MIKFEDQYDIIANEIEKRRGKWTLTSVNHISFDDVKQIILLHLYQKWHIYDQTKPLLPWLNRTISNQIHNITRNNYLNYAKPCSRPENRETCEKHNFECKNCPLYAKWEKSRKRGYDLKLPVSLENHSQEVFSIADDFFDITEEIRRSHLIMSCLLKPKEWQVYKMIYIDFLSDEEAAINLGYVSNEKGRKAGYKMIRNIRVKIIQKFKQAIKDGQILG